MITDNKNHAAEIGDAELVTECLAGRREAFRQIVERHQTLVCSLAYCSTGSLAQSQDLAQETFLSAWRRLAELREPSKLRPWLCGIVRFLISKELRRQGREPVHHAETLEAAEELVSADPLPSDHAMSKEEEAILWRCVARIPQIYREPLVLFYREHQSVERVAEALDLSEDAVKQRLARGRKMLQEEALAYLEGALQNSKPDRTFTSAVLAAVPFSAATGKTVTLAAAVKGSSSAKTALSLTALAAIILYCSLIGFMVFAGICAGYWISRSCARSGRQCQRAAWFWRAITLSFAICFVIRQWLFYLMFMPGGTVESRQLRYYTYEYLQDFFAFVLVIALFIWARAWWRGFSVGNQEETSPGTTVSRKFRFWLALGTIGASCWCVPILGSTLWRVLGPRQMQQISTTQLSRLLAERRDAFFSDRWESGERRLLVLLPENLPESDAWNANHTPGWWRRWVAGCPPAWWNLWSTGSLPLWCVEALTWTGYMPVTLWAPFDESTAKLVTHTHIMHLPAGFRINWLYDPWRFRDILPFFIAPMGMTLFLLQTGRRRMAATTSLASSEPVMHDDPDASPVLLALRDDPRSRHFFGGIVLVAFLIVFGVNAWVTFSPYAMLAMGTVKGVFFAMLCGTAAMHLRTWRKSPKEIASH